METMESYKCPCCAAPLIFRGNMLQCDACGNSFQPEALQQLNEAQANGISTSSYNWESYQPRNFGTDEQFDLAGYSCPSCGAEITGDNSIGSVICPYCGNTNIIKKNFDGAFKPDYVIPFKIDKATAITLFEKACSDAPFLPDEFKDKKKIEEMQGIYIPFWMFDCDCNASISYKATRLTHWCDSNYIYTRTEHFKIIRNGSVGFANIPVDGSKKADDAYMEAVEPFNYADAVNFDTAYLSGYLADRYDVTAEECMPRANERVESSTKNVFRNTINGRYNSVIPENANVSFSDGKIRYSLLPVWMLNIKYEGKNYNFAINGQTGKTVGIFPISKKKRNIYFAKIWAAASAIGAVIATVFQFFL